MRDSVVGHGLWDILVVHGSSIARSSVTKVLRFWVNISIGGPWLSLSSLILMEFSEATGEHSGCNVAVVILIVAFASCVAFPR